MGLMIHSLGELPIEIERGYFIYLLDYGWNEPLGEAIRKNISKMADMASKNNAVVIQGTVGSHFEDEVLSWHHINGQPGEKILPAILITTKHPKQFQNHIFGKDDINHRLILIPLREICETVTDVVELIEKVFNDIKDKKNLSDFKIVKELKKGKGKAIVDSLILQPNMYGLGIDLKKFFKRK